MDYKQNVFTWMTVNKDNLSDIFSEVFNFISSYKESLMKALLVPFIALIVISCIEIVFDLNKFFVFILWIIHLVPYIIIAITTHRMILMDEEEAPAWGGFNLSKYDIFYIAHALAIVAMITAIGLSFYYLPAIVMPIGFILIAYLTGRASLVLPAIVLEENWSFPDSWINSSKHQFMMTITVALFSMIVVIPQYLLSFLPYTQIPITIVSVLTTVIFISALSFAFGVIAESDDSDNYRKINFN